MNLTSETYFKVYCSHAQKAELARRAAEAGLSLPNFVRQRCEIPLEQQGQRKDLITPTPQSNNAMQRTRNQRASHKSKSRARR